MALDFGLSGLLVGLLGAGSSAFGTAGTRRAQKEANKANKQMNDDNIAASYQMQQTANDFTERMWNQENAYNTPEAQAQRYRSAGFNPYMMMGNTSSGIASSVTGTSQSPSSSIPMQPESGAGHLGELNNSIARTIASLEYMDGRSQREADTRKTNAEANLLELNGIGQQIANNWSDRMNDAGVRKLLSDVNLAGENTRGSKLINDFAESSFNDRLRSIKLDNEQKDFMNAKLQVETAIMNKQLPYIDEQQRVQIASAWKQIAVMGKQIALMEETGRLTRNQANHEYWKMIGTILDDRLKNFSKKDAALYRKYTLSRMDYEQYGTSVNLTQQGKFIGENILTPMFSNWSWNGWFKPMYNKK